MQFPRFVDKLVKVFTLARQEKWILVHIEIQGYEDKDFARRMFTYFYRILDKYEKPVTSIAIFTDKNRKFKPNIYEYNFMGTKNTFQFNTYKIIDQDEETLAKNNNPFAIVVLTVLLALKAKKLSDEDILGLKMKVARNLLQRNISSDKTRALMAFLKLYVNFASLETSVKFDEKIDIMTTGTENKEPFGIEERVLEYFRQEGMKKGMKKGMEKGMEKRNAEIIKNLITKMGLSDAQIADIADIPIDYVKKIRKKLKK